MKFSCIKLTERALAFPGVNGAQRPPGSQHLPRRTTFAMPRDRAQAPAYDATIFHTIILHIVGSLNHPRRGGRAVSLRRARSSL